MDAIDKSKYPDGEWQTEPDTVNFRTADDFHAVIIRQSHGGHLCGYVGVPSSHPWYGKSYSDEVAALPEQESRSIDLARISILSLFAHAMGDRTEGMFRIDCLIDVHGGLTYSDHGKHAFGEEPSIWYFGFDCAHSGDFSPGYMRFTDEDKYRDIEYAKREIESLSHQLAMVSKSAQSATSMPHVE